MNRVKNGVWEWVGRQRNMKRLLRQCAIVTAAVLCAGLARAGPPSPPDEFADLLKQIAARKDWDNARLEREVFRREALVLETDKTPVDIVWRRTQALLADLRAVKNPPDLSAEAAALDGLKAEVEALRKQDAPEAPRLRELFAKITALRRRIAFKNPLLDFDAILFLKHNRASVGHMVDQYLGFNAEKAGGVYVLEKPFGEKPAVRSLLKDSAVVNGRLKGRNLENAGAFTGLDLDYDAKTILFAFAEAEREVPENASYDNQYCTKEEMVKHKCAKHYYYRPESAYHIFKARADGSALAQLTDGMWDDGDPCFLPNGRIVFVSSRACGQARCGMRPLPASVLYAMMPDGSDIIPLSWHDTNEWHPSVDNHGMIVYTRWDYVDRDSNIAHHIWHCFPDGRDPRSLHGNYPDRREMRPWMEMSVRAVPGSHRYVAVAAPHHGQAYGSLVMLDLRRPDDRAMSQVRRVTPETLFPESESAPGVPHPKGRHTPNGEVYGSPWPLSEDYYLCVYDTGRRRYGIYLMDSFGNRELLYFDPAIACLDPIPLRPRTRPPVIPTATIQAQADRPDKADLSTGVVAVMNVYDSEFPWPPATKITEIRVVTIFPKDNPFADIPRIGRAAQSLARGVFGTAPVEEDGSAHFKAPAGAAIYFQLLDENGLAVQTMRSDTYLHPGETLACAGCHESKTRAQNASVRKMPLALRRPPSALKPEAEGSYPLTFPRLVQPVLNAKCVGCHEQKQNEKKKPPRLRGDHIVAYGWSEACLNLHKLAWGMSGGNGTALREKQYSLPGQVGALASRLYPLLAKGHHDVKLTPAEMRRITLWLDCNSNFFGAYTDADKQARGEVVRPRWGLPQWTDFAKLVR